MHLIYKGHVSFRWISKLNIQFLYHEYGIAHKINFICVQLMSLLKVSFIFKLRVTETVTNLIIKYNIVYLSAGITVYQAIFAGSATAKREI